MKAKDNSQLTQTRVCVNWRYDKNVFCGYSALEIFLKIRNSHPITRSLSPEKYLTDRRNGFKTVTGIYVSEEGKTLEEFATELMNKMIQKGIINVISVSE